LRIAVIALPVVLFGRTAPGAVCTGDCDADGFVTINEVITGVGVGLDEIPLIACPSADGGGDGSVSIDELLVAVHNALSGCPPMDTPTPTPTATEVPPPATPTATEALPTVTPTVTEMPPTLTPTATPPDVPPIPTTSQALRAWLQAGNYMGWTAESARHASGGPHGGTVRTFVNDIALASLQAGNSSHPAGAALVKELYFNRPTVQLWAVMVKVQADSAGGNGWYWWEGGLAGLGHPACTGCHGSDFNGYTSKDYVLTNFPLQ
jgi:hypothetical protein